MTHKIKALGLAFVAVLAMSSMTVSAAQATSSLDVGSTPAFITGEQLTGANQDKLTIGSGVVTKCTASTFHGTTQTAGAQELTVTPTFSGCQFAGQLMHINTAGCVYTLTSTATALVFNTDLVCPAGKAVTIQQTATGCVVTFKAQGPLGNITLSNVGGAPSHVNLVGALTGIHYEGNASCPPGVSGTHVDGQRTGTTTVKGFQDVEGVEKAQVSLQAT